MKKETKYSIIFIISVLAVSWSFVFLIFSNSTTVELYPFVMLVPALTGLTINITSRQSMQEVFKPVSFRIPFKSVLFSIFYPLIFICFAAMCVYLLGLADINNAKIKELYNLPGLAALIIGPALLFGEEYGWRGFLLQSLAKARGKLFATFITGLVWALWHSLLIFKLAGHYNLGNPLLFTLIQMGVVFVVSVPFAYSYFVSGSIIPPMIFHFIWNWFNPIMLGNIYQNKPGIVEGNMLVINGEGMAGLVLGFACMYWFIKKIRSI